MGLPWLGTILLRGGLAWAACALARRRLPARLGTAAVLLGALNLALLAGEVDCLYYEPFNLTVTHVHLAGPQAGASELRIVHLSDLHVERLTRREERMLAAVEQLQPDLILLTGDYLNWSYVDDPLARHDARLVLSRLRARYGVYAIAGTPCPDTPESMAALFGGLEGVTVLDDEIARVQAGDRTLYLAGLTPRGRLADARTLAGLMRQVPPGAYSILLYHSPDLIDSAAELGVDLYLAGHTHGGQIRLPGVGAILTSSWYGKRYEAGLYRVRGTQLYVSRGLGMEGLGMPRLRFLCPPEVVDIVPDGGG